MKKNTILAFCLLVNIGIGAEQQPGLQPELQPEKLFVYEAQDFAAEKQVYFAFQGATTVFGRATSRMNDLIGGIVCCQIVDYDPWKYFLIRP